MDIPCPACGFLVFQDFYGSYDICPVCDWEDDGVQLANATSGGGANRKSLHEAQQMNLNVFPSECIEARGYRKDPAWRPLTLEEVAVYDRLKERELWHSKAIDDPGRAYWCDE